MVDQDSALKVDLHQVARIVSSYVRHNQVGAGRLAGLIVEVHRTLADLGRVEEPLQPAVPIRRSVRQDYIVCLECGHRTQILRRHLRVAHGLEIAAYRTRWRLPVDYPLTAPAYSVRRSTLAKEIGLGRRAGVELRPPVTQRVPAAVTRRRARRPRRPPAT